MEFSEAKALITINHARRKGSADQVGRRRVPGRRASIETVVVVRNTDEDAPMKEGRDVWYHDALEQADDDALAEEPMPNTRSTSSSTSGSTAKPKGILHTPSGYLTGVAWTTKHVFDLKPDEDVFWCSAATSAGSPATSTSSTA